MARSSSLLGHVGAGVRLGERPVPRSKLIDKEHKLITTFFPEVWTDKRSSPSGTVTSLRERSRGPSRRSYEALYNLHRFPSSQPSGLYNHRQCDIIARGAASGSAIVTSGRGPLRSSEEEAESIAQRQEEEDSIDDEEWEDGEVEESEVEEEGDEGLNLQLSDVDDEEFIRVGVICGTHGLAGELKVHSLTDFPEERFQQAGTRWLRPPGLKKQPLREVRLANGRLGPGRRSRWLVRFKGVTTVEQAEELIGSSILVPISEKPSLEEGEFYTRDLLGLKVVLEGETIGSVEEVTETGASDLLRVLLQDGRRVWVPFVEAIVPVVNQEGGWLEICPPPGLLDLNSTSEGRAKKDKRQQRMKEYRKRRHNLAVVRKRYGAAGQAHALEGLTEGEDEQRAALLEQLLRIDLRDLQEALDKALALEAAASKADALTVRPPPAFPKADWSSSHSWTRGESESEEGGQTRRWWMAGLRQVAGGHVAVLALAGGQGTRLGPQGPPAKGMVDIGLPEGEEGSLFHLQAGRLMAVQAEAAEVVGGGEIRIPWLILTSDATDEATQQFFADHDYFGLESSQVWFIRQGSVPCLSAEGAPPRLLLGSAHRVAEAPGGNGGLFAALAEAGAVERLHRLGVDHVQVYAVDNALVRVADPVFFGFCHERKADLGVKVVQKTAPNEAVGVVCLRQGHEKKLSSRPTDKAYSVGEYYSVMEYSEVPESLRSARESTSDGALLYRAAHICVNSFSVGFLRELCSNEKFQLPYHVARKRIPYVQRNSTGLWEQVEPTTPNGIKLERYIFDAFQYCRPEKVAVLEVERSEEFAPVKNSAGPDAADTAETARALVLAHRAKLAGGG